MAAKRSGRAASGTALLFLLFAGLTLNGCVHKTCPPGEDVVGCGGHWDQIYREIRTPESPG
jgi:hypothetical protein